MSGRSKHGIALVACIVAGALAALGSSAIRTLLFLRWLTVVFGTGCIVRCSAFFFQHHNLFDFDQIRFVLTNFSVRRQQADLPSRLADQCSFVITTHLSTTARN